MLMFSKNQPIKQKRWINTKVEFIWDGSQYVEQSAEGYWYDGDMALCGTLGATTFTGDITLTGDDPYIKIMANEGEGNLGGIGQWDGATPVWRLSDAGSSSSAGYFLMYNDDGSVGIQLYSGSNNYFKTGNLGIGTTAPQTALHLASNYDAGISNIITLQRLDDAATYGGLQWRGSGNTKIWGIDSNTTVGPGIEINEASTNRVYIEPGGNVGIGSTSPGYNLEVAGTFYSAGSSIDYKKHVTDLDVDSSLIHSLRPVSYNYKKEYKDFGYNVKEGKQIGLVSEEVAETIPELAIMKDGRPKNVDYQKLAVVLLAEVQNLKKDIEELKKDN